MENVDRLFLPLPLNTFLNNANCLGQRYLTISHSVGLEAVASHHPEMRKAFLRNLSIVIICGGTLVCILTICLFIKKVFRKVVLFHFRFNSSFTKSDARVLRSSLSPILILFSV